MNNNKRTELVYVHPGFIIERPASDFMYRFKDDPNFDSIYYVGFKTFRMEYGPDEYGHEPGQYPI